MMFRKMLCAAAMSVAAVGAQSAVILVENFENVAALAGQGWVASNTSSPAGTTGWFQGNSTVFPAQAGTSGSYIAANYLNTSALGGNIVNTLYTPVVYVANGETISFWTKTDDDSDPGIAAIATDRLRVLLSVSGGSTALTDFSQLLIINPSAAPGGYPAGWTQFSATVTGLAIGTAGRFALQYNVPLVDSAQNATFPNYIGIDSLQVSTVPVPTPLALGGLGVLIALSLRVQKKKQLTMPSA